MIAVTAALLALVALDDRAHAESGSLNFHGSFGLTIAVPPFSLGVTGGGSFDWQLLPPLAIELGLGGGNVGLFANGQGDTNLFFATFGLRLRFRDHHDGYYDERGGDLWGNWYLAPRAGFLQNVSTGGAFGTVELETGYEFSIARPLQIGPFARAAVAFAGDSQLGPSEFAYFVVGLDVSIALFPLPGHRAPKPPPRPQRPRPPVATPVETDDADDASLPDTDGDGVPDFQDECPDTRPRSKVDARGCAILAREMVLEGITFAFDSAEIQPESEDTLMHAAQSLRDNPTARVEIDGHTDAVGTDAYNLKLSEERALAVASWLVAHGIDEDRLTIRGFGSSRPKALDDTEANRALNRRIEFKRLDAPPPP